MRITYSMPRALCAAAGLTLALAACKDGSAAATSYVLVTQLRPEAPAQFFPRERGLHALCSAAARQKNIAVKPFPTIPGDFVSKRTTYASDGRRTVMREVGWFIDTRKGKVQDGCELRLASTWSAAVISDGQERSADQDENGKVHANEAQPSSNEPVRASLLARYTAPKTVKGVAVKCSDDNTCIVDPALALIKQGVRPVQAAARINDTRTYGTAMVLEPVSLSVGKAVDARLFTLEANP